jgi:hydrogenase expression/formation protein HypC
MCLAIPAKIIEKKNNTAKVDFGDKVQREIDITLVRVKVGDYVLVHAGFAIEVLDKKDAYATLETWNQVFKSI